MTVPVPGPPPRPADPRTLRAEVEAAVAGLDGLDERPVGEHVAVFERVHAALTDALSERGSGPA